MTAPASEEKVDEILAGWETADSGNVAGYPRTTGTPGVPCKELAAYVRALRAALAERTREVQSVRETVDWFSRQLTERTRERDEARRFGEEAAAKYNALIAHGPTLTCAFCGEAYPPGTPATQHDALTAHVKVCDKHPLRIELSRAKSDVAACAELIERAHTNRVGGTCSSFLFEDCPEYACAAARRTLAWAREERNDVPR